MTEKRKLSSESLQAHLLHNPIADMEQRMLATNRPRSWQRATYLFLAFLCVLPFIAMLYYSAEVAAEPNKLRYGVPTHHQVTFTVLMLLYGVNYVLTLIRTLYTAADSFGRERRDKTLEMMLLTGVSVRQIVLGKWVGVLRTVVSDYVYLWVLRVLVLFWGYAEIIHGSLRYQVSGGAEIFPTVLASIPLAGVLLAAVIAAISLVLEALLASSIGMLWVMARKKSVRDLSAMFTYLGVTFLPMILLILVVYGIPAAIIFVTRDYSSYRNIPEPSFFIAMFGTLIDNTMIATAMAMNVAVYPESILTMTDRIPQLAMGVVAGLALYPLITVGALRLAERCVVNPPTISIFAWFRFRQPRKPRREPEFYEAEVV